MIWFKRIFNQTSRPKHSTQVQRSQAPDLSALVKKQSWGLARNEYYKSAQNARKESNIRLALDLLALVIYLDRNGATNIDMNDKELRQLGYSRWDAKLGYFNKNVTSQFSSLFQTLEISKEDFGAHFVELCNKNITRHASTKPPYSPQVVLRDLFHLVDEYNNDT